MLTWEFMTSQYYRGLVLAGCLLMFSRRFPAFLQHNFSHCFSWMDRFVLCAYIHTDTFLVWKRITFPTFPNLPSTLRLSCWSPNTENVVNAAAPVWVLKTLGLCWWKQWHSHPHLLRDWFLLIMSRLQQWSSKGNVFLPVTISPLYQPKLRNRFATLVFPPVIKGWADRWRSCSEF